MDVTTEYIAAAANRHAGVADVSGSLVVFGSSSLVALWDAAVWHSLCQLGLDLITFQRIPTTAESRRHCLVMRASSLASVPLLQPLS
jgi:hypothetical protein